MIECSFENLEYPTTFILYVWYHIYLSTPISLKILQKTLTSHRHVSIYTYNGVPQRVKSVLYNIGESYFSFCYWILFSFLHIISLGSGTVPVIPPVLPLVTMTGMTVVVATVISSVAVIPAVVATVTPIISSVSSSATAVLKKAVFSWSHWKALINSQQVSDSFSRDIYNLTRTNRP